MNKPSTPLRRLHDRLGSMIDQVGQPDYSLRELVNGLREVRDELLLLSERPATADAQDAARYRFLKSRRGNVVAISWNSFHSDIYATAQMGNVDAAIDKAMEEMPQRLQEDHAYTPECHTNGCHFLKPAGDFEAMLRHAVELFEGDDECNSPGTDAWVWLYEARRMLNGTTKR